MGTEKTEGLHLAIIMDGNGRWATRRGLPRVAGHRAGVATVRKVVEHAPDLGIGRMTLYAFSSDNWRRPEDEVQSLFWLFRAYLRLETERLTQRGVRLEVIGRRDRLPGTLVCEIERAELATAQGRSLLLRIAVDYSSRDAITRAAVNATNALSENPQQSPDLLHGVLTRSLANNGGDVDLLIRTGGEKRLSDFLLWESAYAELFFTERMWPDFDETDLENALKEFKRRERRFGGLPANAPHSPQPSIGGAR